MMQLSNKFYYILNILKMLFINFYFVWWEVEILDHSNLFLQNLINLDYLKEELV